MSGCCKTREEFHGNAHLKDDGPRVEAGDVELSARSRVCASLLKRMAEPMNFPDDMELSVALYMADNALPWDRAIEKLLRAELENAGHLPGGQGRPPEVVDGLPSADYVQYRSYLDEDI
jgi:hypothetical protein